MAVTEQKLGLDDWICASLMMVIKLRKTGMRDDAYKTYKTLWWYWYEIWDCPLSTFGIHLTSLRAPPSQGAAGRHISMWPNRQADLRQPRKLRDGLANKKRPCRAAASSSSSILQIFDQNVSPWIFGQFFTWPKQIHKVTIKVEQNPGLYFFVISEILDAMDP